MTNRLTLAAEIVLLTVILALAAVLRLANVAENPAWYTDEATHIDIAQNLLQGEVRYMAVQDSTLLFARPPLFHLLLAGLLRAAPDADATLILRTFTGALGVVSVALVYLLVRLNRRGPLALLAVLALAVCPQAVLYSRFGFSYNLLAPLVLVAMLALTRYLREPRALWLGLAAVALGLGSMVDLVGFTFWIPLVLVVLVARHPKALAWSLPLLVAPFGLYALVMLATAPDAFLFDLRFTLARAGDAGGLAAQLTNVAHNLGVLAGESPWFVVGAAGLFLLRPARLRVVALLLFWLPLLAVGRGFALYSLSAYYLIPFLPLIALGAAGLVGAGLHYLRLASIVVLRRWRLSLRSARRVANGLSAGLLLLVGISLVPAVHENLRATQTGFPTSIDRFLVNTRDARAVAAFINAASTPEDIVIVSPAVGWLLDTQTADFQMTIAAQGRATPHLPADIAPSRWAFQMEYTAARYVVVDNLWHNWGVIHVPGLDALLAAVEAWPLVVEAGELRVYANPTIND